MLKRQAKPCTNLSWLYRRFGVVISVGLFGASLMFSFFGWFHEFEMVFLWISLRVSWVSALCLFMDDLDHSNVRKPPRFDGLWVEFFVRGWVRVIRDSRHSREWETKSFVAYHHLVTHIISPKSYLKSFSRLGDPVTTLGRCSCEFAVFYAVHPRTVRVCLADSPRLADSPKRSRTVLRTF
jgi:hypothetical protein